MILAQLRTAVLAAFPGLDAPRQAVFRIVRTAAERLNLQPVNGSADQTKDLAAVEVWPGVPGVTSEPTPGEEVLVAFVGADGVPVVVARGREGGPGSVPIRVYHDATTEILFVTRTGAKVLIGPAGIGEAERLPVAKATHTKAYLDALEQWALSVDLAIAPAVALLTAPQQATYAAAVSARAAAALNLPLIPTTRLESA